MVKKETPILELRNIKQKYYNEKTQTDFNVFENLNISISDLVKDSKDIGQFAVLMGKSGCGKSTILRYWAGLQKPTEGDVLIHGQHINSLHHIPMVFQQYSSLEWMSVIENIALPLKLKGVKNKEAYESAMEIIKIVGLEGHEHKYAKIPQLSGGQLQRVAIARCLIANPSMMFLDEPFGALDANTRMKMQFFLIDIFKRSELQNFNPTIILVTHDPREAVLLGKDIFILDKGQVAQHIQPDLPSDFDKSIRKDPRFIEIVSYIEDVLEN